MKVLLLCEGYAPGRDACAKRMGVFADHLRACGHEVTVFASSTNLADGATPVADVQYCSAIPMAKKTSFRRFLNNMSFLRSAIKAMDKIDDIDVVVVTSPPLFLALAGRYIAKKEHAKLVFDVRDVWPEIAYEMGSFSSRSLYGWVFSKIACLMYRDADAITVVTEGKERKLACVLQEIGVDTDKLRLVENGLDEAFLDNEIDQVFLEKYRFSQGFSCVYAGNLGLAQGLSQLLDLAAWAKEGSPDARFFLFGKGAEASLLEGQIRLRQLDNVVVGGIVSERQVYTALRYSKMSFVSLKNASMTSSIPTKLYESLGVGCPVLLVACGNACAVLEESGLGVCATPGDKESLVHAFCLLRDNYDNIEALRASATVSVLENHSRQKHAVLFEQVLSGVVLGRGAK